MADRVDDLFANDSKRRGPRLGLPMVLLISGTVLALVGLLCSSAPGGLLVLIGLLRVETERRRVDSGALPESDRAAVTAALRVAYVCMAIVVLLFVVQTVLLCLGVYQGLWGGTFYTLRELLGTLVGGGAAS